MSSRASLQDIFLAQIEEHRTDVVYNLYATNWVGDFVKKLPGCVKCVVGWHALPFQNISFEGYDLMVCNFPSTLAELRQLGYCAEYFFPAYDPAFAPIARWECCLSAAIRAVTRAARWCWKRSRRWPANVALHLDRARPCRLVESPLGRLFAVGEAQAARGRRGSHKRPGIRARLLRGAVVRQDRAKWLDRHAEADRSNMRCFEALGSRSLLLTDEGNYPAGMIAGPTMVTYSSPDHAIGQIKALFEDPAQLSSIATAGHEMISSRYSKEVQWKRFEELVASV